MYVLKKWMAVGRLLSFDKFNHLNNYMTKIHIKFDYTMFYYAALDKELQIRVTSMVECVYKSSMS